jgi:dihydrofolate synthase/folylpolyglutamate synthase
VLNQIQKKKFEQLHIVLGVVNDKDLDEIHPYFQKCYLLFFKINQGIRRDNLSAKREHGDRTVFNSITTAYKTSEDQGY